MNAAKSYGGPDRRVRDDAVDDLRDHFDARMDAMKTHVDGKFAEVDRRMDEHRLHVDKKFAEVSAKLDPIHEHYIMAKRGGAIVAWLATLGAGVAGAWATLKGGK